MDDLIKEAAREIKERDALQAKNEKNFCGIHGWVMNCENWTRKISIFVYACIGTIVYIRKIWTMKC